MKIKAIIVYLTCMLISISISAQLVDTIIMLKDIINIDSINRLSMGNEELHRYFIDCKKHDDTSFTGIDTAYVMTHEGKITVFLEYRNGKKIKASGYHDNGNKYWITNFNGEAEHGLDIVYFKNGNKKYQRYYENGKMVYPSISWYESGNIQTIIDMEEKTGIKNAIVLYESGKLEEIEIGLDSTKYGPSKEQVYYENGILKSETIYRADVQHYVDYWKNGKKAREGKILDWEGFIVGKWTEWYESGMLKREIYYNDSIPNYREGIWKWWDENGNVIKQEKYKDNKLVETKEFLPKAEKKSSE